MSQQAAAPAAPQVQPESPAAGSAAGAQGSAPVAAPAAASAAPTQEKSLLDAPNVSPGGAKEEEGGSLLDEAGGESKPVESKEANPNDNKGSEKPNSQDKPVEYTDFKLPEGVQADAAALDQFKGVAKELGLSQDQAQKLVDMQANAVKQQQDAAQAQWNETVKTWKAEAIQSLGANYQKELAVAAKARDRFASPELRQLLNETGLANHKEVIGLFMQVGKQISEDSFADGKSGQQGTKSAAEVLYPNHPTKRQ